MSDKIKKYIKETIKLIVILAVILNIASYYQAQDLNKEKLDLETFTLLDNSKYTIPQDKPVLIHFWATWCPTCALEGANIDRVSKDYEVITIASQSGTKKEIKEYMKKHNLNFKVVNDDEGLYSQKFNIAAFPTTFIYDKDKNLKFSEVGYTSTFGLYARMWWSK